MGDPEQRARPWSTVFRLSTDDGRAAWSKANGPGPSHEVAVLARFAARGEPVVLSPLALDAATGWILTDDRAPTLRAAAGPDGRPGDQDLDRWSAVLGRFADLQRRAEADVPDLLAAGVPDERPARYPDLLAAQLAHAPMWERVDPDERPRTDAARRRLEALLPHITQLATELASSPIAPSLDHGDLHGNNVLVGGDGSIRLFDWGDSVVAHPFASQTTTLGSLTYHAGLDLDGPELTRIRDAYTEHWTDVATRAELDRAAGLALDLGAIGKTAAWERAVQGLAPDEMLGFHGAAAQWLADTVDRFERWSPG